MNAAELERQIAAIASLNEPIRRGLYLYVTGRRRDVGRDEAARARRISRALAAFHLDKLVELGLLETSYRRLGARRGPGAGRPAKLYRRSPRQLDLSLPPRHYDLAGRLLTRALASGPPTARRALKRAAHEAGRRLVAEVRRHGRRTPDPLALLTRMGYEPVRVGGEVRLGNCPFAALASECPPVVCEMNLALLRGLVAGSGSRARLAAAPGACCVVLRAPARAGR